MWLRAIHVKALEDNGATDPADSQTKLLATRVLTIVRLLCSADVKQDLASLFKLGLDAKELNEEVSEFGDALVVILHRHTFPLPRRITLLKEARELYREESESPLWEAVTASPRGREVLDKAWVHLEDCI